MNWRPWVFLAGGGIGLYFLWKFISGSLNAKTCAEDPTSTDPKCVAARNAATKATQAAAFASDCAAKGGLLTYDQGVADCHITDSIVIAPAAAYGSCPDRLSCQGQPQGGYQGKPYTPTPPSNGPRSVLPACIGGLSLTNGPRGLNCA